MIEMTRFALAVIVISAGMMGCIGTCGLLFYCVRDDRSKRAKARRQRDHRRTRACGC